MVLRELRSTSGHPDGRRGDLRRGRVLVPQFDGPANDRRVAPSHDEDIPLLEDLIVPIAVSVEAAVTMAVGLHNPDISAPAHRYHVAIDDGGDILVGWRWQAGFLDRLLNNDRRRGSGRHGRCDDGACLRRVGYDQATGR